MTERCSSQREEAATLEEYRRGRQLQAQFIASKAVQTLFSLDTSQSSQRIRHPHDCKAEQSLAFTPRLEDPSPRSLSLSVFKVSLLKRAKREGLHDASLYRNKFTKQLLEKALRAVSILISFRGETYRRQRWTWTEELITAFIETLLQSSCRMMDLATIAENRLHKRNPSLDEAILSAQKVMASPGQWSDEEERREKPERNRLNTARNRRSAYGEEVYSYHLATDPMQPEQLLLTWLHCIFFQRDEH